MSCPPKIHRIPAKAVRGAVSGGTYQPVREAVGEAVDQAAWEAVDGAVGGAVWRAVGGAVDLVGEASHRAP